MKDLRIAIDCPTRLMMQCFEVINWDTMSNAADPVDLSCAYEILMRILKKPPDSKTIEDLHQRLRVKNKKKAHERLTPSSHCELIRCDLIAWHPSSCSYDS